MIILMAQDFVLAFRAVFENADKPGQQQTNELPHFLFLPLCRHIQRGFQA